MDRRRKSFAHEAKPERSRKALIMSIVSLILAFLVLVSSTWCWFAIKTGEGHSGNIKLDLGNGLRVNDLGQTEEEVSDKSYLLPASSVDGRNLFFSSDGSFTKKTENLTYRTANAGDRNYSYVQLDYDLTAEENYTNIYLDTKIPEGNTKPRTYLYFKGWDSDTDAHANGFENRNQALQASKALRAAVWYEGIEDNKPIVFNTQSKITSTQAVSEIDRSTGEFILREKQTAYPFKEYSYGYRQIGKLDKGETRRFSILVWLEGTDETHCTSDRTDIDLTGKKIDFSLAFTTSWENTERIYFEDRTTNSEVATFLASPANRNCSLVLNYNNPTHKINNYKFTMYKDSSDNSGHTWYCDIPGIAYNDLSFKIINDTTGDVVYNWDKDTNGDDTLNRGDSTKYIAETLDANTGSSNNSRGHWFDGEIEENGNGYDHGRIDDNDDDDW
ncbi:MAG: hypothetical protein IIU14_06135 [Ruminococcus sp.]|nr:hypothetical protein [Ruminococcus sp.]